MNIACTVDDLTATSCSSPQIVLSCNRRWGFAHWILLAGILSGLGALVLSAVAICRS